MLLCLRFSFILYPQVVGKSQKITLWHGETLDENGNFTQKNYDPGERNKDGIPQKITYICKDGLNEYKPSFTIFGFRYAKVETDADLSGPEFTAVAVYSRMPQTGFFSCGNFFASKLSTSFKVILLCSCSFPSSSIFAWRLDVSMPDMELSLWESNFSANLDALSVMLL